jgi:hypothetical protein
MTSVRQNIEDIDLTLPLAGTEGHDVNHVSRVRTQYLFAQHNALLTQIQFADAKAGALMTVMGLIVLRGPIAWNSDNVPPLLHHSFLFLSAVAVIFCFWTVFPRYPGKAARRKLAEDERWSWLALSAETMSPAEYGAFMQTSEVSQLVHSVARSNAAVAAILLRKYTALRIGFVAAFGVLLLLGVHVYGSY